MVQAKHKKSKPPKKQHQTRVKKHGKQIDIAQFRLQLDGLGLKIIQVTPDGLYLTSWKAVKMSIKSIAIWLCSISRCTRKTLSLSLKMKPRLMSTAGPWGRMVHGQEIWNYKRLLWLQEVIFASIGSYHDGEHYNSVRLKEDPGNGPAKEITIKVDAEVSLTSHQANSTVNKSRGLTGGRNTDMNSIKLVMVGTGCKKLKKVEQILQDVDGDVDAAIEYLIAEKEVNEDVSSEELSCENENNVSHVRDNGRRMEGSQDMKCGDSIANGDLGLVHDVSFQHDNKKIPKNKACSCGSRKKHKASCGLSVGKSTSGPLKNNRLNASKGRNERRDNKKGEVRGPTHGSMVLPDVGALCI